MTDPTTPLWVEVVVPDEGEVTCIRLLDIERDEYLRAERIARAMLAVEEAAREVIRGWLMRQVSYPNVDSNMPPMISALDNLDAARKS